MTAWWRWWEAVNSGNPSPIFCLQFSCMHIFSFAYLTLCSFLLACFACLPCCLHHQNTTSLHTHTDPNNFFFPHSVSGKFNSLHTCPLPPSASPPSQWMDPYLVIFHFSFSGHFVCFSSYSLLCLHAIINLRASISQSYSLNR